jgi:hypothetical protein
MVSIVRIHFSPARRRLLRSFVGVMVVAAAYAAGAQDARDRAPLSFNRDVRPILADNCFRCHGPDANQREAGLRLDQSDAARADLDSGAVAIVPGDPDESELVRRVFSVEDFERMPPPDSGKALTEAQKHVLRRWIESGAEYQPHWAFMRIDRPAPPQVVNANWIRNPIDAFVLKRLEQAGLAPSRAANRRTLLRRVTLDLTGLPPTIEEVDAFLADDAPDAHERAVDRLLASPRYGERMAMFWLDLARYADTDGYDKDSHRQMWPYRDWVIEAFNANMPFDRFTLEQLAGDLLPEPTRAKLIATAFNRNGRTTSEAGADPEEYAVKYAVDRVNTTAAVWLGLTMQCAECHDHKFDPITTADFYSMLAFFNQLPEDALYEGPDAPPALRLYTPEQQARDDKLTAKLAAAKADRDRTKAEKPDAPDGPDVAARIAALKNDLKRLRAQAPAVRIMQDVPQRRPTYIRVRGDYRMLGDAVSPGVPASLGSLDPGVPRNRLALANWLISADNPLTARVAVNRLWALCFGASLVRTPDDFGTQGQWPTHPELLDWLASEFVARGWDVKAVLRLIVTSSAYRQSSAAGQADYEADPDNRLLARGPRTRLAAEMIRDSALFASGLLQERIGGPSVHPYHPPGMWEEIAWSDSRWKTWPQDHGAGLYRRALYTFWKRSLLHPVLAVFDAPNRDICTCQRPLTNTPLQSLATLNETSFVETARWLAQRVLMEEPGDDQARLNRLYTLVLSRHADEREQAVLLPLLDRTRRKFDADPQAAASLLEVGEAPRLATLDPAELAAWSVVAQSVLNLDETLTKE